MEFFATGPQFDDRRLFGMLAFRNGLEYYNCDFSNTYHFCTIVTDLVRFGLVTPEFQT